MKTLILLFVVALATAEEPKDYEFVADEHHDTDALLETLVEVRKASLNKLKTYFQRFTMRVRRLRTCTRSVRASKDVR